MMTMEMREIDACRLCCSTNLGDYVDFGSVPLGNNLQPTAEAARAAESYVLNLKRCNDCGHFQLGYAVHPEVLYATNYTYLSGIGSSFVKHFSDYAAWVAQMCDLPEKSLVVDVGSNDGTCLKAFQAQGHLVCGVDPASLAARIANENGIETINGFFDDDAVGEIARRHGLADFITSHNVLAHVDDFGAVFRNIYSLLKENGYFCFEVGYFRDVLKKGNFDTIYHEHLDYHHAAPLVRHLKALGFSVVDISVNEIQGGSIRILSRKTGGAGDAPGVSAFLAEESQSILNDRLFLSDWKRTIEANMSAFQDMLYSCVVQGRVLAGYGAPTKATLLMRMANIGSREISFIVEDNPHKIGLFMPASAVPIVSSKELEGRDFDVLVLFAWNFAEDIISKLSGRFDRPVKLIVPLPKLRTVTL